jgi:hypothetical protein
VHNGAAVHYEPVSEQDEEDLMDVDDDKLIKEMNSGCVWTRNIDETGWTKIEASSADHPAPRSRHSMRADS